MPIADADERRAYQARWVASRRAAYFAGKRCGKCGSVEELELDHVDPSQKISHKIWSWSATRRAAELAKCQVLCSTCHKAKTLRDSGHDGHGNQHMYRKGCRCDVCKAWARADWQRYPRTRNKLRAQAREAKRIPNP